MSLHFVETSEEESCLVIARFIGDVVDGEKVSRQQETCFLGILLEPTHADKGEQIYLV